MIESDFVRNVNNKLNPKEVFSWKINDNFQGGVPDSWYIGVGNAKDTVNGQFLPLFVEYKYLKTLPKRETTFIIPSLSEQQLDWLEMLVKSGHQAMVIVGANFGSSNKGVVYTQAEWLEGITRKEFMERAVSYAELAQVIKNCVYGVAHK